MPAPSSLKPPSSARRTRSDGPPSPLFFSNTGVSNRLTRLPSLAASEPSAGLLARIREEPEGTVTTLKLPRAKISANNPARSGSTPNSYGSSVDMSAPSLSPDPRPILPQGLQVLHGIGVLELLEQDGRPSFLVDLSHSANGSRPGLPILYCNPALKQAPGLLRLLDPDHTDPGATALFHSFKSWATTNTFPDGADLPLEPTEYGGVVWTCSTLRRRFRFISGTGQAEPAASLRAASPDLMDTDLPIGDTSSLFPSPSQPTTPVAEEIEGNGYFPSISRKSSQHEPEILRQADPVMDTDRRHPDDFTNQVLQSQPVKSSFDWTRLPDEDSLPDHIRFARSIDWASTCLGPFEDWAHDLRAMSNLVMGSPHPAAMYWGPEHICIYNAAYIDLAGHKHPGLMGQSYKSGWHEIWDDMKPIFESAWESGQAIMKQENCLFINRHGFLEETFFSWSIVPIIGSEGEVVGLYNPAFENTRRRVNERRMFTLRDIGERTATATAVEEFWPQVHSGLDHNVPDVPFCLVYSVREDTDSEVSSMHSGSMINPPQLILESSIGVPEGHPAAATQLDMKNSNEGFAPYLRQSMAMGSGPIYLSREEGTLPEGLIDNIRSRAFGDVGTSVIIFPIVPTTTTEATAGFVVMGVNTRRPYDEDYKLFIHLLARQLATSMASVVLFEEEIKRGQRAARLAALDRQELSMQLVLRTQEASESEFRFTSLAEFAPVGMFIADSRGRITYCNETWWKISGLPPSEASQSHWMDSVRSEDRQKLESEWMTLVERKDPISLEFRFKCSQRKDDKTIDTWVLMNAFPERMPNGHLKSIFGCITDISSQKWAEKVQSERREEAVELKRQQENFIDITSHEMRNPLSAILQCADQISDSISSFTAYRQKDEVEQLLESCLDAANTINLCASHQKRIVDDILTLSKLDSNLLAVTPVDEQPIRVVQRALKMFEAELVAHDIEFEFRVDESFNKYGIKWAKLDPSRLRQVLINLMTNAIKFTQGRERRNITVILSASREKSEVHNNGVLFFDRDDSVRTVAMDIDSSEEWGHGDRFNIHCSVEDTGPGLSEEELGLLFQRFHQASPRTHVQYGGSGLGLFISRILTEMQGGQIGVASERGRGSRFNFYIQSRKSLNPPSEYEHVTPFKIIRRNPLPVTNNTASSQQATMPSPRNAPSDPISPMFDVLIVEDNIVNQKVLQRQLRNCGNNTFVANHGSEALETLQRSSFWIGQESNGVDISVILMDLEMPVMDGMTCARRIRELEREGKIVKHIPIIAVTAYARPEQIENAKAAGIVRFHHHNYYSSPLTVQDDVISKPFRIPELMPKIEELVGKYRDLAASA